MTDRIVLVTGATGRQGGALVRLLSGKGFKLRAMTRKPDGEAATALAKLGIEIIRGDLDDEASLAKALTGAWGVFAVQNTYEAGVEGEERQGLRIANLARERGVHHYVYTSVGSADRNTGIPHFENKFRIEEEVRRLKFPSFAILRPVFFMENLLSPWFLNDEMLISALDPNTTLQMTAVDDIGRVASRLFIDADQMNGREVDLAGDAATMTKVAEVLSQSLGRSIRYLQVPLAEIRKRSDDVAIMQEWFGRVGFDADIPALEREFGKLTKLDEWARKTVHAQAT